MCTKICKICKEEKPINQFYGSAYTCKRCVCSINSNKAYQKRVERYKDLPNEMWKSIQGYENLYEVSNFGRVKSVSGNFKGLILKGVVHRQGYIRIYLVKNRVKKSFLIHRLVAEAFIPNPLNKKTVNHKDLDKSNNCVDNLEWNTQLENNRHAIASGVVYYTDKMKEASTRGFKIMRNDVPVIIKKFEHGKTISELSDEYNVSKAQICRIVNRKSRITCK